MQIEPDNIQRGQTSQDFSQASAASEDHYTPFIREVLAFHARLEKGHNLEKADASKFLSVTAIESLVDRAGLTPDDKFYKRQGFSAGRQGFLKSHQRITRALLPNLFNQLREKTEQNSNEAQATFKTLIAYIHECDLPTVYPPNIKLLSALGCSDQADFQPVFNAHTDTYVSTALKEVVSRHNLTHIPEDSPFATDTSLNATLNYIFSHATEEEFWQIALAIELSGIDFDEKDWAAGILVGKYAAPDLTLDINGPTAD